MAMFVAILPCRVYAEEDGSSGGTDPSAPKVNNTYTHTYHTNVKITANVTEIMHDGSNSLTSETQVQKESGFIEGSVSSETVQAMITSLKNEIRNQYNQAYSSKETVTSTKLIFDHFESANIVTDASGNTITDIEDLKKILAGDIVNLEEKYGQITKNLDVHEYQVYELEYNLTLYDEETEIPNVDIENVSAKGDYFGMNTNNLIMKNFQLVGNYSFDGSRNVEVHDSKLISKDAFWNTENVTVYDSFITGEYLGWNAKNLTLINCTIESLQGLCYIDNLVMKNCKLINTTLAFEYSSVDAEICSKVDSVLNPTSGVIRAKEIGTLTIEKDRVDPSKTKIICEGK